MEISNDQILREFITHLKLQDLSDLTISQRKFNLRQFIRWIKKPLTDVKRSDIKNYIVHKKDTNGWKKSNTFRSHIVTLKILFQFLIDENIIKAEDNPVQGIKMPKNSSKDFEARPLTSDELRRTCMVADAYSTGIKNRTIFYILLSSGMRARELTQIKKEDINFKKGMIFLPKDITKGKITSRIVPISPRAKACIKEFLLKERSSSEYLFSNNGGHIVYMHVFKAVEDIIARAFPYPEKFKKGYGPHTLRHTFFSNFAEVNSDVEAMRVIAGWAGYQQVNRYIHTSQVFLENQIKKMGKSLWKKIHSC